MSTVSPPSIVFFGSSEFSLFALLALKHSDMMPALIITAPDRPKGRNLVLTPTPVKTWALQEGVPIIEDISVLKEKARDIKPDLFVLSSYGTIIPQAILDLAPHGTLNIHPSLLPKFRGASPLQSAILADEKETGVTIMLMDAKMDHGPIVAQQAIPLRQEEEILSAKELERKLGELGAELLVRVIPQWIDGKIQPKEQDHTAATYTKKIAKEDGLLDLSANQRGNYLKIQAYEGWPGTYFFAQKGDKKTRVIIKKAQWKDGKLRILRVIPEGKKEMDYEQFGSM